MLRRDVSNCTHESERGQISSIFICPRLKPGMIMKICLGHMIVPRRCLRIRLPSPASLALCENCHSLNVSLVPGTFLGTLSLIIHYLCCSQWPYKVCMLLFPVYGWGNWVALSDWKSLNLFSTFRYIPDSIITVYELATNWSSPNRFESLITSTGLRFWWKAPYIRVLHHVVLLPIPGTLLENRIPRRWTWNICNSTRGAEREQ